MVSNKQTPAKKGLFKTVLEKYNQLCKEMGVDQGGGCRRCVPIIKQDPEPEKPTKKED
ncbi:DUF5363 domain-containing protein [Testudinibacter aquarius]|uniref:DUF5363 family protein n=1 Tax=Testudinibacter aquarius TaxID=1524974 RepID=A0A4R3Y4F5_9PAST|nr:DUF5363 domain-containing protein [Testudinibacter aquarius]TCV85254.1 hypothetical protein EDC16_10932 [Testudinibacter aquarius]